MDRVYKRYRAFQTTCGLLVVGFGLAVWQSEPAIFSTFSQILGGAYAFYLGGQSATDWVKAKNGG